MIALEYLSDTQLSETLRVCVSLLRELQERRDVATRNLQQLIETAKELSAQSEEIERLRARVVELEKKP